jgi:hypothetical protein
MTTWRRVRLEGGPLHGQVHDIETWRKSKTFDWADGTVQRNWGDDNNPFWVAVAPTEIETYTATDDPNIFEWAPAAAAFEHLPDRTTEEQ